MKGFKYRERLRYQLELGKEFADVSSGAFSRNVGKLFSELKLVTDNHSLYAAVNWEVTERFLHHYGNLPEVTKSVHIITSPVLILFTSMWHGNPRTWGWLYILPLCGFGLGVELVLFPDTQYGTHTVLQSGNEIGWSLHRGSQTIQVRPWCKC